MFIYILTNSYYPKFHKGPKSLLTPHIPVVALQAPISTSPDRIYDMQKKLKS